MNTRLLMQFRHTLTQRAGLGKTRFGRIAQQIGHADGHDDTVNRLAGAIAFQQIDKTVPLCGIAHALALLQRITPRGINQHCAVGKPPVAVAGAADATNRLFTQRIGQREIEARIEQRGGFTGTGRTHNQIPGQLVEVIGIKAREQIAAVTPAKLGAFQLHRRFAEALIKPLLSHLTFRRIVVARQLKLGQ